MWESGASPSAAGPFGRSASLLGIISSGGLTLDLFRRRPSSGQQHADAPVGVPDVELARAVQQQVRGAVELGLPRQAVDVAATATSRHQAAPPRRRGDPGDCCSRSWAPLTAAVSLSSFAGPFPCGQTSWIDSGVHCSGSVPSPTSTFFLGAFATGAGCGAGAAAGAGAVEALAVAGFTGAAGFARRRLGEIRRRRGGVDFAFSATVTVRSLSGTNVLTCLPPRGPVTSSRRALVERASARGGDTGSPSSSSVAPAGNPSMRMDTSALPALWARCTALTPEPGSAAPASLAGVADPAAWWAADCSGMLAGFARSPPPGWSLPVEEVQATTPPTTATAATSRGPEGGISSCECSNRGRAKVNRPGSRGESAAGHPRTDLRSGSCSS